MNRELEIWQFAAQRLKQNEPVMLLTVAESAGSSPGRPGFKMIVAADYLVHAPREVAIVGPMDAEGTRALLDTARRKFVPNKIVAWVDPASADAAGTAERLPLLAAKGLVDGKPAAYVCKDYACQRPVTTPEELAAQLGV